MRRPITPMAHSIEHTRKPKSVAVPTMPVQMSNETAATTLRRRQGPRAARTTRWTINGDYIALKATGVARYAAEVVLALDTLYAEGHALTQGIDLDLVARQPVDLDAIRVRVVPEFGALRIPQAWVQLQLPRHVQGGLLSFCNLAPISVTRQIVCIHDLHTRLMPESYGLMFRLAHRLVLPILGRRAARITTVSELSRQTLTKYGIAPDHKITVTYNGSDHTTRWDAARSTISVDQFQRPYVLCLGRDQAYKNVELLIRLAPMLDAQGIDLWMAGDATEATLMRYSADLPPNLKLLGRISDDDFKKALTGAVCFLFPSRIEGFGIPAVEAMATGCPVIASTAPCLPEVCGDAALFADPDDIGRWNNAVERIRSDPALRRCLIAAGFERARRYSWRQIAETYLELMHDVDAEADREISSSR
jgi:glycosyltransferase involved in cell wall biosynthesis